MNLQVVLTKYSFKSSYQSRYVCLVIVSLSSIHARHKNANYRLAECDTAKLLVLSVKLKVSLNIRRVVSL